MIKNNSFAEMVNNWFFLEHVGELHIIILKRREGFRTRTTPHTHTKQEIIRTASKRN